MRRSAFYIIINALLLAGINLYAQETTIVVDAKNPGAKVQSTMYGIFFEDINFAADGGLYAELIKNRSFEFDNHLMGWVPFGNVQVLNEKPCFDRNPNYIRLSLNNEITGTGIDNEGFKGMGLKKDEQYNLSFYSRNVGHDTLNVQVQLLSRANDIIASQNIQIKNKEWTKYSVSLKPEVTDKYGRFRLIFLNKGAADFDHISLFPAKTYKNHPNGMRDDLAKVLEDLRPGLLRFPGGCIVEGTALDNRYQWKETIGPVENRPTNINRWNYIPSKKFPDYYQSYGLGFYEYFLLSEDIGAEPLPVINCGMVCQFVSNSDEENCSVAELQPYIQDALDLIEFANGPSDSQWGKVRAEMGHPASFNLKYLAVGNEQWDEPYVKRLEPFIKAIREKYPEIKIVGSSGPAPDGNHFDYGWKEMNRLKADLVDEHYYKDPDWFLHHANRYDNYDRKGPKVFAGEYACHLDGGRNSFEAALCEAAFMTGLERNADVVHMTAYAPLFAHAENWQWHPDLIWFDNLNVVRTPNYYVQKLYANHPGNNVLKTNCNGAFLAGQDSLYASSVIDKNKSEIILKVVNVSKLSRTIRIDIDGLKKGEHKAVHTKFYHRNLKAENTFEDQNQVVPVEKNIRVSGNIPNLEIEPCSFHLIKIQNR